MRRLCGRSGQSSILYTLSFFTQYFQTQLDVLFFLLACYVFQFHTLHSASVVNIGPLRFDSNIEREQVQGCVGVVAVVRSSISHQLGSISSNQAISGPMTGLTIPTLTSYHNHIHIIRSHPLIPGQNTAHRVFNTAVLYTQTQKKIR